MVSVDDVFANMSGEERENFILGDSVELVRIPTPSIGITQGLGGGWVKGRQGLVWGSKSAGKSTFMMQQIAMCQQLGYSCAYIDAEEAYDKSWAKRLGVDTGELIYRNAKSMNKVMNDGASLLRAGVDVLILDSASTLVPAAYLEKNGEELKKMEETGALGALARDTSKMLSMFNYENDDTLFLIVAQSRMKNVGTRWVAGPTNGTSMEYYTQQCVNLFSSHSKDNTIDGEVTNGDLVIQKPIGRRVHWLVEYNKLGPEQWTGKYDLFYDGDFVGIDVAGELLDVAVKMGVVKKGGAWYSYDGDSLGQGRDTVAAKMREDEDLLKAVKQDIGYTG